MPYTGHAFMNNGNHEDIRKKMESGWPHFVRSATELSLSLAETHCTCTYAAEQLSSLLHMHKCSAVNTDTSVLVQLEDCRLARKSLR